MAYNPEPKIDDCRTIAQKWGDPQVIILSLSEDGLLSMATYGETKKLCIVAGMLGQVAFDAIKAYIATMIKQMEQAKGA